MSIKLSSDRSQAISLVLMCGGVLLLILNIILGDKVNISLPFVFILLGAAVFVLTFALSKRWRWAFGLFIPGSILVALGVIFLLNVITNDWNSWAYAWLLLLAGGGWGLALAGWYGEWRRDILFIGAMLVVFGFVFYAVFGAIAGGAVIRISAPILLVLGGLALRWLPLEDILPETVSDWLRLSKKEEGGSVMAGGVKTTANLVEPLSTRELEVLALINRGLSNPEIAAELVVAPSTIKTHINNLYGKLGVQNRVQAIQRARELGLLE
ncbi:hypothetical protein ADN00_06240 [Ornatilinea apprima]|uniref:HTH luxR-type domain-containing protein n=1 Tax=Ornatilinea apprima TaxID=1134406 RepID=A0A0P6X9T5_9CHLR|nr:LuxR C-terminal-related transcriptional regulator [Ornatilinea apprima]KPL78816.1 hypothetical protein ADN00_06240 [Ornatilinea apprima]